MVAIKCIDRKRLTNTSMENILTEIKVTKDLNHEHIGRLFEFEVSCALYRVVHSPRVLAPVN